jgi:hypothetical protein
MKTLSKNIFFLIVAGVIATSSCKKETVSDYRDVYLGKWLFITERVIHDGVDPSQSSRDTLMSEGEIKYGNSGNSIITKYLPYDSITLVVGIDGKLSNFPTQYCNGEFIGNTSLQMFLRYGGLGSFSEYQITGNKSIR